MTLRGFLREAGHRTKYECGRDKKEEESCFLKVFISKNKATISHKYLGRDGERDGAGAWPLPPLLFHTVL